MKCPHCGKETEEKLEASKIDLDFLTFRKYYPPRLGGQRWPEARRYFERLIGQRIPAKTLISKARAYGIYCAGEEMLRTVFVMQAATFLGDGGGWDEPWEAKASAEDAVLEAFR